MVPYNSFKALSIYYKHVEIYPTYCSLSFRCLIIIAIEYLLHGIYHPKIVHIFTSFDFYYNFSYGILLIKNLKVYMYVLWAEL